MPGHLENRRSNDSFDLTPPEISNKLEFLIKSAPSETALKEKKL